MLSVARSLLRAFLLSFPAVPIARGRFRTDRLHTSLEFLACFLCSRSNTAASVRVSQRPSLVTRIHPLLAAPLQLHKPIGGQARTSRWLWECGGVSWLIAGQPMPISVSSQARMVW